MSSASEPLSRALDVVAVLEQQDFKKLPHAPFIIYDKNFRGARVLRHSNHPEVKIMRRKKPPCLPQAS